MRVKRIVFINRAPFGNLDLDLSDKNVISLTGINGSGKTTILSYIVDAFYEIAKKVFYNEFSGTKEGKFYRIMSQLFNVNRKECSLVYILFDMSGKEITYFDIGGISSEVEFNKLMVVLFNDSDASSWPIMYSDVSINLQNGNKSVKYIKIDEDDANEIFNKRILTYFPSYRYEQPGYLNDVYRMKLTHRMMSKFTGYLENPIEVTSDLPEIANWILDLVLDGGLYGDREKVVKQNLDIIISNILSNKLKRKTRFAIGRRNLGGARIQVVDAENGTSIYPSLFNISAGEASLLCIFGEIIKQADRIGKGHIIGDVEGIVIVDEVDKHLHIKLQMEILPVLIKMFPKIQFILSTHSPFVNIGLHDELGNACSILDLDNNCRECDSSENEVFRQAYDVMVSENERYADLCRELKELLNNMTKPIVYLEGETDHKYFAKALEVFGYTDVNIEFKWIGHIGDNGKAEFTGKDSMNNAISFFKANKPSTRQLFLFDCDTYKQEFDDGNIIVMCMQKYENHKNMDKGMENALVLDDLDCEQFYDKHEVKKDYGGKALISDLDKMKMCNYICNLDADSQKKIFSNLKTTIDRIISKLNENSKNDK